MNLGNQACVCGRKNKNALLSFAKCCERYLDHFDTTPAPSAEYLMRSRYSAFVLERADYLQNTWHQTTRPSELTFEQGVKWLGLDVRAYRLIDPEHAEVEFVAASRLKGRPIRLHELSRFVREDGRWFYVDGTQR